MSTPDRTPALAPVAEPPTARSAASLSRAAGQRPPVRACSSRWSLVVILFQITTGGVMLKSLNVTNIFLQNGYIMVMALGMLLVIVIGHIDLSVGSVAAFIGAIAAVLMVEPAARSGPSPSSLTLVAGAADRRLAGLLGRLPRRAVVHRHARRACSCSAALTLWMLGGQPVGPFAGELPGDRLGLLPGDDRHRSRIRSARGPAFMIGPVPLPFGGGPLQLTTLVLGAIWLPSWSRCSACARVASRSNTGSGLVDRPASSCSGTC